MPTTKKAAPKGRAVLVGALAAKLLGHSRTSNAGPLSARQIALAFPSFNAQELAYAIDELVDKGLFRQSGDRGNYTLTDYGREGRVGVS